MNHSKAFNPKVQTYTDWRSSISRSRQGSSAIMSQNQFLTSTYSIQKKANATLNKNFGQVIKFTSAQFIPSSPAKQNKRQRLENESPTKIERFKLHDGRRDSFSRRSKIGEMDPRYSQASQTGMNLLKNFAESSNIDFMSTGTHRKLDGVIRERLKEIEN